MDTDATLQERRHTPRRRSDRLDRLKNRWSFEIDMHTMSFSSKLSPAIMCWLCALIVLMSVTAVTAAPQFKQVKRGICTKNMACKWAVCPYNIHHPIFIPTEDMCLVINNEGCQCGDGQVCAVSDVMDPGQSSVKFEYRCQTEDWNGFNSMVRRAAAAAKGEK